MSIGIVLGYSNISYQYWTLLSIGIVISALLNRKLKPKFNAQYLLYFIFLFLQLGFFSIKTRQPKPNNFLEDGMYQLQCEIIELQEGDKKWNKGVAQINQIFTENEEERTCQEKLLFYTDKKTSRQLAEGDIVLLESQIQKIQNKGNPGEFNASYYWGSKDTYFLSFFTHSDYFQIINAKPRIKNLFKKSIIKNLKRYVSQDYLGIVKALFLGDKSSLDQETRYSFSAAGAMHLLAISGLHIGLFIWIIYGLLRLFSRVVKRNVALVVALLFIWLYAYLIDFPPSVLRSVIMFSILSLGYFRRGIKNQLNILLFSATILLLIDPLYLLDIGYQLSYAAMLGIILCSKSISQLYRFKNRLLNFFWAATALCLSAQLFTFPICLYYFHQFPNYFILSNLGIVIFAGTIVGLGGGLIILSQFAFIAEKIAFLLSIMLALLIAFIEWVEHLPGALSKGFVLQNIELGLLLLGCVGVYWNLIYKKRMLTGGLIALSIFSIIAFNHHRQLTSKHLVMFNTNRFSCAIHIKNVTYFFHDNLLPKKYLPLLSDYDKCYPGKMHVINLKNQNIATSSLGHKINFSWKEKDLILQVNDQIYGICYSQKDALKDGNKKIGLAWVEGTNIRLNKAYFFNF